MLLCRKKLLTNTPAMHKLHWSHYIMEYLITDLGGLSWKQGIF